MLSISPHRPVRARLLHRLRHSMYVRVVRQNRAGTYLNRIAELVESGIARGEGIRLPEPWSPFERPNPDEQMNCTKERHLPGKVVEMLQFFKTEHLLQMPLPSLASGKADVVDILHHAVYVSAAVRRHAFLDRDEVAPLLVRIVWKTGQVAYIVVDSLDRRAGSVVSPECTGRGGFGPGSQCAAV